MPCKLSKRVLGHVLAGTLFGDTHLADNDRNSFSDEVSDWRSSDDEVEVIESLDNHIDKGLYPTLA